MHDAIAGHWRTCPRTTLARAEVNFVHSAALNVNIRIKPQQKPLGRLVLQRHHKIHHGKSRKDFGAFGKRRHRTRLVSGSTAVRRFANSPVILQRDDKNVSQRSRLFEQTHVPGMKQIERPASRHHPLAFAAPCGSPFNQILSGDNFSQALTYTRGKRPKISAVQFYQAPLRLNTHCGCTIFFVIKARW